MLKGEVTEIGIISGVHSVIGQIFVFIYLALPISGRDTATA